jgi:tRNA A-37 threonylcarbamoyl transferase component Bud32
MLGAPEAFPSVRFDNDIVVGTPQLYFAESQSRVQVLEEIPGAVDLRETLFSQNADTLTTKHASQLCFAVGRWLKEFHKWKSCRAK